MLMSRLFGERLRESPADALLQSHKILLKGGYIRPSAGGIFTLLPPARRVTRNLEAILREEMDALGGQEVLFPFVMPGSLWEESGRYDTVGSELVRFSDRSGKNLVLGMTHEEAAVQAARTEAKSHSQYPFMIYQIQTKFRDEPRPRGGLLRTREFTMKDAYSFHTGKGDLAAYYEQVKAAYYRIFRKAGLKNITAVESDSGMMGGGKTNEFMFLSDCGEDTLYLCESCGHGANAEVLTGEGLCPACGHSLTTRRGVEVGHIFQLGDKYAKSMGMTYTDKTGKQQVPLMGCYGIGVGRLMACAIEENHDERGPLWPAAIAPWQIHLCTLGLKDKNAGLSLYRTLQAVGSVMLDDRNVSAGVQFADADLLGAPLRVIVSKKGLAKGEVEIASRDGSFREYVSVENAAQAVNARLQRLLSQQ